MLTIIGGTYLELCHDPNWYELYGSGLRAAIALSRVVQNISFISCLGDEEKGSFESICATYDIDPCIHKIPCTFAFEYYHPLSAPIYFPEPKEILVFSDIKADNILFFGMLEATVKLDGRYVVYDPQNGKSFKETKSRAEHLAIVLNRNEAMLLSDARKDDDLEDIGKKLLINESAEVIIIKDGTNGAFVIENNNTTRIPVFKTNSVWPIGSGDIFSSAFAWQWMVEKKTPVEAACKASLFTANYCQFRQLPLSVEPKELIALPIKREKKTIYLAGPFFTTSERWLINELYFLLKSFGNNVFSPFHEIKSDDPTEITIQDLEALTKADIVFGIVSGLDAGTLFEIGYAKSLNKRIIILAENVKIEDLTLLIGSDCEVTNDLTSAIYMTSW